MYAFRCLEARRRELAFNVVGVWTSATKSRATSYMQAHEGFRRYGDWIRQRPTVVLGDFNDNVSFKTTNWGRLLELVEPLGLVSAYHSHFNEPFGAESRPTYFHRSQLASPAHLDYCFVPKEWAQRISRVEVGSYEDWRAHSDHAPLVVDLDL